MRFGGRLQAAIEILSEIEARRRPVADALRDWGKSHRFAGSGDRAAIGNIVYDALRWRRSSAWAADSDDVRKVVLAMVARRWALPEGGLAEAIAGDPHAPELLPADEMAAVVARDLDTAPDDVRADVPEWLAGPLAETFDEAWVAEGQASASRPPLDLRVNTLKADREKVAKALARFGPSTEGPSPDGLRIAPTTDAGRHPNVQVEGAFSKGWFEVQDQGSQLAARMSLATSGEKVLDLCAGGGGKSLALAAIMGNSGQVFASDADRHRLAPIRDRLRRAGTRNVQVRDAGSSLDDLAGHLDMVLVDAPCTGTGTWRRRPDTKWRLRPEAIVRRAEEQAALLDQAADLVAPGGRVAYVTCSLLDAENRAQVRAFVDRRADFVVKPGAELAAHAGLAPEMAYLSQEGALMTPLRTGTDAFFVAVLERQA